MAHARPLCILLAIASCAAAQSKPSEEIFTPDHESAIARGLAYLARQQQADGSILNRDPNSPDSAPRFSGQKVILTSASVVAFLSAGRVPDMGKHGLAVRNALDFLLKSAPDDGFFGKVDGSRMAGHALATIALAEAYGMEYDARQRKRLRTVLDRCVRVLLSAQHVKKDAPLAGGWHDDPASGDNSLVATGWAVLALRAASNAGIDVPKASADRAAAFVLRCWRPEKGSFANHPGHDPSPKAAAMGVLCLEMLDRSARPEAGQAMTWLIDHPAADDAALPYLCRFAGTLAAFESGGEMWARAWNRTQAAILPLQQKDGSWPDSRGGSEPGKVYNTATSVLTLSIPLRLMPGWQR